MVAYRLAVVLLYLAFPWYVCQPPPSWPIHPCCHCCRTSIRFCAPFATLFLSPLCILYCCLWLPDCVRATFVTHRVAAYSLGHSDGPISCRFLTGPLPPYVLLSCLTWRCLRNSPLLCHCPSQTRTSQCCLLALIPFGVTCPYSSSSPPVYLLPLVYPSVVTWLP